jgi:CRISPR-associated protein Cmr1
MAGEEGGKSSVGLDIELVSGSSPLVVGGTSDLVDDGEKVKDDINLARVEAYAMFGARAEVEKHGRRIARVKEPPGQRVLPDVLFTLRVRVADAAFREQVEDTLRAWVLFGGIGGRTRRGCGSLAFQDTATARPSWLPQPDSIRFELGEATAVQREVAGRLKGATWCIGASSKRAIDAWEVALGWLREFRQGPASTTSLNRLHARAAGKASTKPGRSNWPESDKLRRLGLITDGHPPRFDSTPAWPRASFGLPIVMDFKDGQPGKKKAELVWTGGDRLASPLILKPLQLADGRYAPLALWLERELPPNAAVFVKDNRTLPGGVSTDAPFDHMKGGRDTDQFDALVGKTTVREAFIDWLCAKPGIRKGTL